jgi:hypothetical protein
MLYYSNTDVKRIKTPSPCFVLKILLNYILISWPKSKILNLKSKIKLRVSYIGITPAFQADERGSTPLTRSRKTKQFYQGLFCFT